MILAQSSVFAELALPKTGLADSACPGSCVSGTAVRYAIAAFGSLRASADELLRLRREPGSRAGKTFSPAFLKHADDQTVAAVAALSQAIAKQNWESRSFRDWGVLAAPNLFGRFGNEAAFRRFQSEGAWGISPHMIPHHSLHAVSGTISQAWQIRGPNFGVSGGPAAAAEAFLVAATMMSGMMSDRKLSGLWLVVTGFDPEYIPEKGTGKPIHPTSCLAAVFALTPGSPAAGFLRVGCEASEQADPDWPDFSLRLLVNHIEQSSDEKCVRWRLPGMGWMELDLLIGAGKQL